MDHHEDLDSGGVEEKKEEETSYLRYPQQSSEQPTAPPPPTLYNNSPRHKRTEDESAGQNDGFQSWLDTFTKALIGSCGIAVEAASLMLQGDCRWPKRAARTAAKTRQEERPKESKPPLSIVEELKVLAMQPGYQPPVRHERRSSTIPRFLGEESVLPFEEDDDVSALSQHTLEEMNRNGRFLHHAAVHRRKSSNPHVTRDERHEPPPSPTRTSSLSTTSSSDKKRRGEEQEPTELEI